ncbi:type 1 glutamine amidotransferase [Halopenitus persicus]|uniref:GMP synthase (Glutamine-hydrolysing) n=1 Tax=Halopenitus persicus TaxID=1048396 RepID=A0A1H3HBI7_9EURY|nr:type 1 glutamine amidotransferase [Halopenitus persicus]QHS16050.1 type 1 glutamine amidotransferase [haloarchaeon 3A1-DGR]SDY12238.1 GMP synthase (glutamine-hydrolysing) [Halopenitus persicus]
MILVLDDEVNPEYRYLGPEIAEFTPDSEYHVYAEDPETPPLSAFDGVIVSGSTASVYEDGYPWFETQMELVRRCLEESIPLLGVCFGHQLVNYALGGDVIEDRRRATFVEMRTLDADDTILAGVNPVVPVLHSDLVVEPGEGMEPIAETEYNDYFCTRHVDAPVWTVQFHPEFTERVRDRPSDWSDGDHTFAECNATAVLENFAAYCEP